MDSSVIVAIVGALATIIVAFITKKAETDRPQTPTFNPEGPRNPSRRPTLVFLSAAAFGLALTSLISTLFFVKGPPGPEGPPGPGALPVGGIVMWWGNWEADRGQLANYELCDGGKVYTKGSLLEGQPKPNFVGTFPRGAAKGVTDVKGNGKRHEGSETISLRWPSRPFP